MTPIVGEVGFTGWAVMTTFGEDGDPHPKALDTLYVYVPAARPVRVVLVPAPVVVLPPGVLVNIQVPEGKLFNSTLPVANAHVGCIMFPTEGAMGVDGCSLITTFVEDGDTHPDALVTV